MSEPKLVIFDMDGVLVNSEAAFRRACSEILLKWNVSAEYDEFVPFTGMGDAKYIGGVSEAHGVPYVPEMTDLSYKLYKEYAKELLHVFDWSREVLLKLNSSNVKIAIASSAGDFKVDVNIDCIGVDKGIFSAIITGSDVENKKPAPDIFLAAAKKAGELPQNCLVIEDAISGVEAARAAGMRVAAVTTSFSREQLEESGATFVCDDLREVLGHFFTL